MPKKAKRENKMERRVLVTIRSGGTKKPATFETWRYWEIVGELVWRSANRLDAYDAARWCGRFAKPGDRRELFPDITMEVKENEQNPDHDKPPS